MLVEKATSLVITNQHTYVLSHKSLPGKFARLIKNRESREERRDGKTDYN